MAWPISASDVRTELKWSANSGPGPDPLEVFASAAVERVEAEIGPHHGQPVAVTARGPRRSVTFPCTVASLVSISASGTDLDASGFELDAEAGIVTGQFPPGPLVVTGTAPSGVPAPVELATRYLAATWVKQSKVGPPSARSRASEPDADALQGFGMPRRVTEMIRPYVPVWGFA